MKKIVNMIYLLGIAAAVSTITIEPMKFCQCNNFALQSDCQAVGQKCLWKDKTCTFNSCSAISQKDQCAGTTKCQWNASTLACVSFVACSDLKAATNEGCLGLSVQCPGSLNGVCQPTIPAACSNYTVKSDCTEGSDGICFWNGTTCALWSKCEQATTSGDCQKATFACSWNNTACISSVCSNFTAPTTCYFTQANPYQNIYSLCIWSSSNSACTPGENSQLVSSDCLTHSQGYFSWSSNNAASGSCQQCSLASSSGIFVQGIIVGLLLILA